MKILKRRGQWIDLCGAPALKLQDELKDGPILALWFRLVR